MKKTRNDTRRDARSSQHRLETLDDVALAHVTGGGGTGVITQNCRLIYTLCYQVS